jgi:hypothetical protein
MDPLELEENRALVGYYAANSGNLPGSGIDATHDSQLATVIYPFGTGIWHLNFSTFCI